MYAFWGKFNMTEGGERGVMVGQGAFEEKT